MSSVIDNFNSYVIGVHNYYRYATHVRKVFDKIAFQISRKFYARTKRKLEPVHIKIASKIIARVRFPKYRTSSLS